LTSYTDAEGRHYNGVKCQMCGGEVQQCDCDACTECGKPYNGGWTYISPWDEDEDWDDPSWCNECREGVIAFQERLILNPQSIFQDLQNAMRDNGVSEKTTRQIMGGES
jgi:hypothetical protein